MAELNIRLRALLYAIPEVERILASVPGADYKQVLLTMLENLPPGQDRMQELRSRLEELRASAVEL